MGAWRGGDRAVALFGKALAPDGSPRPDASTCTTSSGPRSGSSTGRRCTTSPCSATTTTPPPSLPAAFLHTVSTARRHNVQPTGNAARGYDSLPTVGPTNFYIDGGSSKPDAMIQEVPRGLYVTGTAGFGFDIAAGEYSQQVEGIWIEGGKLAGQLRDVAYQATTTDFWGSLDAVGGRSTWLLHGAMNCGKAQPGQVAAVSHGCPSARFRGINVLNTQEEGQ